MTLTKEEILATRPKRETIAAFGGEVTVQGLNVNRRMALSDFLYEERPNAVTGRPELFGRDGRHLWPAYAALGIVDDKGEPVFTLAEAEALGETDPASLEAVYQTIRRLSGFDAPKAQSGDSPSDSPSPSA